MITLKDFSPIVEESPLYLGVTAQVQTGCILPVMGPSGCGKTSLLNALRGDIRYTGTTSLHKQDTFSVFQHHNQLFPWFTNRHNLNLVCKKPFEDLAHQWNVGEQLGNYPDQVSIGQRQRLALLRGICSGKPVLLCDEPLSAVDNITGIKIAKDFRSLVENLGITCVWITHNIIEAKLLSDNAVVILDNTAKLVKGTEIEQLFSASA